MTRIVSALELEKLGAPPAVSAAIVTFRDDLIAVAGENLAAVVLYGSLARGRFRPGKSDVNVAVLLREAGVSGLEPLAGPIRKAYRAARIEPFLLTLDELRDTADVFATKLLDVRRHHVVLHGDDPFRDLAVAREHVRFRVEQELRNLCLRLRRRYVALAGDPVALESALEAIVTPLTVELASLLDLVGERPAHDEAPEVFEAAAAAFDLDRDALASLAKLGHAPSPGGRDAAAFFDRILASVARAARAADRLEAMP